jgi:hypothetical protein
MTSTFYTGDPSFVDNGGVHTNSGVNNKAAYLIAEPGAKSFNGQTITGLGLLKTARIYYDVQTQFLTSGSDYADLASALGQACDDLVGVGLPNGAGAITTTECGEVRQAVAATEMTVDPPNAPAPHAPAAVCPAGQVRTDLFFDDMEDPGAGNWALGGVWQFLDANDYAHSGVGSLWGNDVSLVSNTTAAMTQSVRIPANATSAYLRFDHAYDFEFDGGGAYDGGVLELSTGGGFADIGALLTDVGYSGTITTISNNPIEGRQAFVRRSNGYRASRATLTSLKGQDVRFQFRIGTDGTGAGTGWLIDDVHVYSCAPPPTPPTPTDSDGDGVPDASDGCRSTPAATPDGCPVSTGPPFGEPTTPPPSGGGSTAALATAKVRSCTGTGRGKRARVRCTLSGSRAVRRATVTVKRNGRTVAKKTLRPAAGGVLSFKPKGTLRKGTYKVTIVIRDAAGARRTLRKSFKIR